MVENHFLSKGECDKTTKYVNTSTRDLPQPQLHNSILNCRPVHGTMVQEKKLCNRLLSSVEPASEQSQKLPKRAGALSLAGEFM